MTPADEESRLSEAERRATAAEKELELFAYSVSHDFRSPLRSILSAAMILSEDFGDSLPSDATDELKRITRSAHKMSSLLDSLLRFSRLSRQAMTVEVLNFSELANGVKNEVARKFEDIEITIAPDIHLTGDGELFKVVLGELIENAVKFGAKKVEISSCEAGFCVSDNGIGFESDQADRIFVPFEKINGDEYPGNGMGLALVQRAILRHRGSVSAEAKPGEGAKIYVRLP